jgi:hypothetical protein
MPGRIINIKPLPPHWSKDQIKAWIETIAGSGSVVSLTKNPYDSTSFFVQMTSEGLPIILDGGEWAAPYDNCAVVSVS